MGNFSQKRKMGNIFYSKPVLFVLIVLLLGFAWIVVGQIEKIRITKENKRIAESRMQELQAEKDLLSAQIAKLETAEGVEENIRMKFGLAKEGERVVVVVEEKVKEGEGETEKEGIFSRIKGWFGWD